MRGNVVVVVVVVFVVVVVVVIVAVVLNFLVVQVVGLLVQKNILPAGKPELQNILKREDKG